MQTEEVSLHEYCGGHSYLFSTVICGLAGAFIDETNCKQLFSINSNREVSVQSEYSCTNYLNILMHYDEKEICLRFILFRSIEATSLGAIRQRNFLKY